MRVGSLVTRYIYGDERSRVSWGIVTGIVEDNRQYVVFWDDGQFSCPHWDSLIIEVE